MQVKVGLTTYEGRPVQHADGSRGVLLRDVNGMPAGPDTTGSWCVPVLWYEGRSAKRWPVFSLAELVRDVNGGQAVE